MTIKEWLFSKLTSNVGISAIVGTNVSGDFGDYDDIPCIVYSELGFNRNLLLRVPVFSIKAIHSTQAEVETLAELIYDLFDNSAVSLREQSSNLSIENINIINYQSSVFDPTNKKWYSILDIEIFYSK